jgi:hypothetical protein
MNKNRICALMVVAILMLSGFLLAKPESKDASLATPIRSDDANELMMAPAPASVPLPKITLTKGEFYFRIDGTPGFIFSRNLSGNKPDDWAVLAAQAHQHGDLVVRVGAENSFMGGYYGYGYTSNGEIREDWSKNWENFLDIAEDNGVYVFPFFSGWINWDQNFLSGWAHNPFNSANGGPAKDSGELFKKDSPTQLLFLKWFKDVVKRWSKHDNILAWEPIGEVNLFKGVTEKSAIYFIEQLAKIVREGDPLKRPTTFSMAGNLNEWPNFYRNDAIDFINIHPYPSSGPSSGQLDRGILTDTQKILDQFKKPVMIGESGLSADNPDRKPPTYTTAARAEVGIKHAIWIAMVSGVMNGRALWYEDSYALYFPALSWSFINKYMDAEVPAVRFIKEVDYSDFRLLKTQFASTIFGAAIGNEKLIIGWFRDAKCEPPDWNTQLLITGQKVTITLPGTKTTWLVKFYDTKTGTNLIDSTTLTSKGNKMIIPLPDFRDDVAFKMFPLQ